MRCKYLFFVPAIVGMNFKGNLIFSLDGSMHFLTHHSMHFLIPNDKELRYLGREMNSFRGILALIL